MRLCSCRRHLLLHNWCSQRRLMLLAMVSAIVEWHLGIDTVPLQQASSAPLRANLYHDPAQASGNSIVATIPLGTPPQPQNLTLSFTAPITTVQCGGQSGGFEPFRSSTFRHRRIGGREYSDDTIRLNATDGMSGETPAAARHVAFRCRRGRGAAAELALGGGQLALPAQLAASLGLRRVLGYCLPDGALFLGGSNRSYFVRGAPAGGFRSIYFSQTPLHVSAKKRSDPGPYSISVTAVAVDGAAVDVAAPFRLHVGATGRYTRLERGVYRRLRVAFRRSVAFRARAAPAVRPFDTCFNASGLASTRAGPAVPAVGLRLSGGATWQIHGRNSVVAAGSDVLCWAFVDAGANAPSVLGTYQQEENFVELDLERSLFRFSGLIYLIQTTCRSFHFNS